MFLEGLVWIKPFSFYAFDTYDKAVNFRHVYLFNSFYMSTTDFGVLASKIDPF